jgi:radical SAM superfamily enzyme with C-terminal helix-hairpin-helix motif
VKKRQSSGKGFLYPLHQSEKLRTCHPKVTGLCSFVYKAFYPGKKTWRVLDFVN